MNIFSTSSMLGRKYNFSSDPANEHDEHFAICYLQVKKLNLNIFTCAHKQKFPPCSYHHLQTEGNYSLGHL